MVESSGRIYRYADFLEESEKIPQDALQLSTGIAEERSLDGIDAADIMDACCEMVAVDLVGFRFFPIVP
ncbi:MAG: hypothetical protein ABF791_08680 [Acetobacter sp.]|uniref:hypothetical protein n=1 Tax=Acetobacter sp. TaxID=440 RepID=UPI0039EC1BAB